MTNTNKTDDFFSEENEAKVGWAKFIKIGDTVRGILTSVSDKPEQGNFPAQKIYTLKTDKGMINVGFPIYKTFVISSMKGATIGQEVGFKYASDYQTDENKKKGMAPAKTIKVYLGDVVETAEAFSEEPSVDDVPFK
ncbi:MAG: hypothetical protein HF967_08645 [Methanosarcinales archaeon]|nr:hypothetical protein [Methanosarcinales archaeon]